MKQVLLSAILVLGSSLAMAQQAPTYCHTKEACVENGGKVSRTGMKCLYTDGQVSSFVWVCDAQHPNFAHYGKDDQQTRDDNEIDYGGTYDGQDD